MKVLITGAAGFIGFHLSKRLMMRGDHVTALDSLNDYYDPKLKYARLVELGIYAEDLEYGEMTHSATSRHAKFIKLDINDTKGMRNLFEEEQFDTVCHLAAQAGVRYSLSNPHAYVESNIKGFLNVLESCRIHQIKHLVYASSSSVYGLNKKMPFSADDHANHPVSLYAASKKSNELMAHAYSHIFNIPCTALRFFTVYGPWGRPDMALFLFTKAMFEDKPINIFNNGEMKRDFTHVDDIVSGIVLSLDAPPQTTPEWDAKAAKPSSSSAAHRVFNIGNGNPVSLLDFINEIENILGKTTIKNYLPMQDGDVTETYADIDAIKNELNYQPRISIGEGVRDFIDWYYDFYVNT